MRYFHVSFKFAISMFMSCHKLRVLRKRGRLRAHSRAPGPSHSNANTLFNVSVAHSLSNKTIKCGDITLDF